tara:strand:- start:82 stop:309 length:228 start_codon:yes stop_codon:yes gene_type:complete
MLYTTKVYVDDGEPFIKSKRLVGTSIESTADDSEMMAMHYAIKFCKEYNIDLAKKLHSIETKEIDKKSLARMVYN